MPQRYGELACGPAEIEQLASEIRRREWDVIEIGDLSVAGLGGGSTIVRKGNAMVREVLGAEVGEPGAEIFQGLIGLLQSDPALDGERLTRLDGRFAREIDRAVTAMAEADHPMTLADLPESMRDELLAADGRRNLNTPDNAAEYSITVVPVIQRSALRRPFGGGPAGGEHGPPRSS